ncbi:hypothetical protein BH23GEM5_BH23GEM5_03300 [soil metagenome]
MICLRTCLALALFALCTSPAGAQSLLARQGLGYAVEPLDARARALGGVGLGLSGINLSLVNPAAVAGTPAAAFLVGFQFDRTEADVGTGSTVGRIPRFPVIHAALPLGERWVFSVGYGGFLDQSWAAEVEDTLRGLRGQPTLVRDRFTSRGGVARLRLGGARTFGERFAVGVAADIFTGVVQDSFVREFPDTATGLFLARALSFSERSYGGVGYAAGARWTPSEALNVGASISGGGRLRAEGPEGERSYALPFTGALGASGRVARRTLVAASGSWTGWAGTADDLLQPGDVRSVWVLSAGVEQELEGRLERAYPLRLGVRYATLPFSWTAGAFPTERALTGGFGARLGAGAARVDFGAERGWRDAGGSVFQEDFWRFSASMTVLGR